MSLPFQQLQVLVTLVLVQSEPMAPKAAPKPAAAKPKAKARAQAEAPRGVFVRLFRPSFCGQEQVLVSSTGRRGLPSAGFCKDV